MPPAGYTPVTTRQGMCLDDTNDMGRDGEPVQLWTCENNLNQAWQAQPDGTIRNANGWCLGIGSAADKYAATANGSGLVMVACDKDDRGSYWTVSPDGQIVNKYSETAMDNKGDSQQDGNRVQISSTPTGSGSQAWTAVPSGGGFPVVTPNSPPDLHIAKANMVTSTGQVFMPRGFTISTLEYPYPYLDHDKVYAHNSSGMLAETDAEIDAVAGAWDGNIVRLQFEQDELVQKCTGAPGAVSSAVANTTYLHWINDVVSYAKTKGLVVVLNDQTEIGYTAWPHPKTSEPMPTLETECAWKILAPDYHTNDSVIIDPFNEPRAGAVGATPYMEFWLRGGLDDGTKYIGFQDLTDWLRSDHGGDYKANILWVEPPAGPDNNALQGLGLTGQRNYLLSGMSNISYSFHHPTVLGTARTPANWNLQFGDLVRLDELSVDDGEWNTRSIRTKFVAKDDGDSGPCWSDAPTAVPRYFSYLENLGVGLTAWTLTDGSPGIGMTSESDTGSFTKPATMVGWPHKSSGKGECLNEKPVLGPGSLLMDWFKQQAGS